MKTAVLTLALLSCGCAARHAVKTSVSELVPAVCLRVQIKDFKKPCTVLANGDLLCDQVLVHPVCVRVSGK